VELHTSAGTSRAFWNRERRQRRRGLPQRYRGELAQIRGILDRLRGELARDAQGLSSEVRQLINSIIRQLIIIGTAGMVIALAGAILVTRSITGPLAVLKGAALQVGTAISGQLDHQVPGRDWRSVGFPQGNGRQSAPAGEGRSREQRACLCPLPRTRVHGGGNRCSR